MKKLTIGLLALCFLVTGAFAKKTQLMPDNFEYDLLVSTIDSLSSPYVKGNQAIFTADKNARHVGIAFDFENYRIIHSFQKRTIQDFDFKTVDALYFYILDLPKDVQEINYRLVVDGLWTTDPLNSQTTYNEQEGIVLSYLDASREIPPATEQLDNNVVHFVYKGSRGQQIRIGGNFTNWDSWIYTRNEVQPGLYTLDLPLPPGRYEYAYYNGMSTLPDVTNPTRCYTTDGRIASLLIVK